MVRVCVVAESEFLTKNETAFVCSVMFVGEVYVSSSWPSIEYVVVGGVAPLFTGTMVPATPTAVPAKKISPSEINSLNEERTIELEYDSRPHCRRIRERPVCGRRKPIQMRPVVGSIVAQPSVLRCIIDNYWLGRIVGGLHGYRRGWMSPHAEQRHARGGSLWEQGKNERQPGTWLCCRTHQHQPSRRPRTSSTCLDGSLMWLSLLCLERMSPRGSSDGQRGFHLGAAISARRDFASFGRRAGFMARSM